MAGLVLHEYARSGNCYKIRLTAAHVGAALERREYDIMKGETRTPEFLSRVNANGRIPTLQIGAEDSWRFLPESNAACLYLAHGTSLIPGDRFDHADMMRWLFWEQYNHEPNVATLRFWYGWIGEANFSEVQRVNLPGKRAAGLAALELMDEHLAKADWFAAGRFTIADIALYAYTHVCEEGGYQLSCYPNVQAWLARVAAQPGHVAIDA
ncbi:glutathione S-transferase family protein [Sphingomonas sp. LB-2]|uniref:glutathione S-transferase family protein n=1 Tax=Sphingomonas caeni TaxID=2984949 RepID=UPI0022311A24|nr:glutathione S-transferase family protein [Sphingomonas caeni]MCW3845886.1 glutathione S-transferase family protein [Sphingomonas caeni]